MEKVLITGGSEGIGLAFARAYAKRGAVVFLAARHQAKLAQAAAALHRQYNSNIKTFACDLSQNGSAERLFDELKTENIDILINNAGCGYFGEALSIDVAADENMIHLNDASLVTLMKLFGRQMKARNSGIILNVASTGAFQPGPYTASYYASKAFVLNYTKALKEELRGTGVKVYCLCPGPVDTSFYQKSGGSMNLYHMSADSCAAYALHHMKKQTVLIPGFLNQVAAVLPVSWKVQWLSREKKKTLK